MLARFKSLVMRLLLERRTHALEVFLAFEALIGGGWLLWPGQNGFTEYTWLSLIPDAVLGGVLIVHAIGALMALRAGNVHMCRRSALASAAIWSFMVAIFAMSPPRTLFAIPLISVLAVGSIWVYVRLYLRYPPPGVK